MKKFTLLLVLVTFSMTTKAIQYTKGSSRISADDFDKCSEKFTEKLHKKSFLLATEDKLLKKL